MPLLEEFEARGLLDLRVESEHGIVESSELLRALDRCQETPWLGSAWPREGERGSEAVLTILGDGLECARSASLVGRSSGREVPLLDLQPINDGRISARVPPWPESDGEVHDLVVETPCGWAVEGAAWTWYRGGAPDVTMILPPAGPTEGGARLRLLGTGLDLVTHVLIGDALVPSTDWTLVSPGEIVVTSTPPSSTPPYVRSVWVRARNRSEVDPTPLAYLYRAAGPPRCDSFEPTQGPWTGGTRVTVHGASLDSVESVTFEQRASIWLELLDRTSLAVRTMGPAAPGTEASVVLRWGDGQQVTCPGTFTFMP